MSRQDQSRIESFAEKAESFPTVSRWTTVALTVVLAGWMLLAIAATGWSP